jgi:hypothetical protein
MAALILALPIHASSAAELLVPVAENDRERLASPTNYGLRELLYAAKRHRFVYINFDALGKSDDELVISAFYDLQLRIRIKDVTGYDQLQEYTGELVKPDFEGIYGTDGKPLDLPPQAVNLNVRGSPQEVPFELARRIAGGTNEAEQFTPDPDASEGTTFSVVPLTTLHATIFVLALGNYIMIEPVPDDPRFHVIYEQDREMVPQGSEYLSPKEADKLRRRNEFLKELKREKAEAEASGLLD